MSVVISCITILLKASEWYQMISIACMTLASMYSFVRLGRDYLVIWKMYQAEEVILRQQIAAHQ